MIGAFVMMLIELADLNRLRKRYFTENGARQFYALNWVYNVCIMAALGSRVQGDEEGGAMKGNLGWELHIYCSF